MRHSKTDYFFVMRPGNQNAETHKGPLPYLTRGGAGALIIIGSCQEFLSKFSTTRSIM